MDEAAFRMIVAQMRDAQEKERRGDAGARRSARDYERRVDAELRRFYLPGLFEGRRREGT